LALNSSSTISDDCKLSKDYRHTATKIKSGKSYPTKMADSLVFDFPDPTPHFDFDNSSHGAGSSATGGGGGATSSSTPTKKTSSKKSRALFKNRFMNKTNNGNGSQRSPASPVPSDNYDSPLNKSMGDQSGTTATTASMSVGSGGSRTPNRSSSLYGGIMNGGGGGGRNNNNMSTKNSAVAPPPPSSNNNGQNSPKFEFTLFDEAASPKSSTGMRKSLLSNKPNPYSNLTSSFSFTSTSSSAGNQQQQHQRHLSGDLANPYGLSSDRTAASGYISEVSEFSFDRVTVTTERTGMSSNVSWNFLEGQYGGGGGLLDALGSGGGGGGGTGGATKLQPPDIDKLLLDEDDLLDGPNHNHHHHQGNRTSNHRMNVFTGEIHEKCDQSVISEISEGIDGHDDDILHQGGGVGGSGGGAGNGMDFINSILTEKYDTMDVAVQQQQPKNDTKVSSSSAPAPAPQQRQSSPTQQQQLSRKTVVTVGTASGTAVSTTTTNARGNNNNTVSTVSSTNNSAGGITSVESAYNKFKRNKNKGKAENRSILHAIIEDIQFCGMYFCGLDTTSVEPDPDDGQLTDHQLQRDVSPHSTPSKEDRAKEMDNTFLGKFIQCTPCGADTTMIPDDATPSTR
jgi:hypothetical protein